MNGALGGGATLHVDFKCFVCKERLQDVRPVPGDTTLYACLKCVPVGQEQTAVLQHRIKQLRRESSAHFARYTAACVEIARAQVELDALTGSGCESVRLNLSDESGLGGERICGQPVVAVLDVGTDHAWRVCAECAAVMHPSRLTRLAEVEIDPAESFRTAWQQAMSDDVLPVFQLWDGIEEVGG